MAGVKPSSLVEEAEEVLRVQQQVVELPVVELSQAERYAQRYYAHMVFLQVSRTVNKCICQQNYCKAACLQDTLRRNGVALMQARGGGCY